MKKEVARERIAARLEALATLFEEQLKEDLKQAQKDRVRRHLNITNSWLKQIRRKNVNIRKLAKEICHSAGKAFDAYFLNSSLTKKVDLAIYALWNTCNDILYPFPKYIKGGCPAGRRRK